MKIVKFKDGTYGIRRWWFLGWQYRDFHPISFFEWRRLGDANFGNCKIFNYENARRLLDYLQDKGEVVKPPENNH